MIAHNMSPTFMIFVNYYCTILTQRSSTDFTTLNYALIHEQTFFFQSPYFVAVHYLCYINYSLMHI